MLLSFRFTNHRSFRDEQQLNLTPVYESDSDRPSTEALSVAGIFGANASGKSNLLHALSTMRIFAIRSDREVEPGLGGGTALSREPFRLDGQSMSEPSRYVVDLYLSGAHHTYGFTLTSEGIAEEWLYHYPKKKQRTIFERTYQKIKVVSETSKRAELESIAKITAPQALFLSTVARFNARNTTMFGKSGDDPMLDVYRWFYTLRSRSRPGLRHPIGFNTAWAETESTRITIVSLLQAADVGILDVKLKQPVQEALFDDIGEQGEPDAIERRRRASRRERQRLQFSHRGSVGDVFLELEDESTGTQQLLDLAIDAEYVLRNGRVMTVDEIDASLHPMLTAKLISLFQDRATNPSGAQIVFTSHDATLLGTLDGEEVVHRDQVWFTEKEPDGSSSLYPLSDFRPRKDENRQRRYLNGSYGAVPDLSTDLFMQALEARGDLHASE